MALHLFLGDITKVRADAIVNAANSSLLGGGGVDGAIHAAGGPEILAECRALRAGDLRDGLPTGQAVATTAGRLPAKWVIHTVGPIYRGGPQDAQLLADAYRNSLRVARELGAGSVCFPAISTGVYRYPMAAAAAVALAAVTEPSDQIEIGIVLRDQLALGVFAAAAKERGVAYDGAWPGA